MRVLYATDGGAAAVDAGRLLDALADRERTQVTAASVIATGPPEPRHLSAWLRSDGLRRRVSTDALDAAVDGLRQSGFDVEGVVAEGRPADTIRDLAVQHDAALIVVGTGVRWFGGRLLGSVSTSLVHDAPASVLVVQAPPAGAPAEVVVGVDGSEPALAALDVAMDLLDAARCRVMVVSAAKLLVPSLSAPFTGYATSAPSPEIEQEALAPVRAHAQQAATRLAARGFTVDTRAMLGHPVKRLLAEIDHSGAALAVVGARGLGALDRSVLGSVSDQVLRHAPATLVGRWRRRSASAGAPADGATRGP